MDGCTFFMMFIIYALFGGSEVVVSQYLVADWAEHSIMGTIHSYVYIALISLALLSHFRAANADPGRVPKDAEPVDENGQDARFIYRECRYCDAYRPSRAHHCSFCDACILKLDHHCPWTGQCIGVGNHKYFLLFVSYTALACTYPLLLLAYRWAACHWGFTWEGDQLCAGHGRGWLIALGGVAVFMFFFTSCIVVDQVDSIRFTRSAHAALPAKDKDRHSKLSSNLREIFGSNGRFSPKWLVPTAPRFSPDDWERIVGYSVPGSAEGHDHGHDHGDAEHGTLAASSASASGAVQRV